MLAMVGWVRLAAPMALLEQQTLVAAAAVLAGLTLVTAAKVS